MKRIIIFLSMVLLLSFGVNAQTLSTNTIAAPAVGNNVDVPIDVTGIATVYTLTVYVEYDNTVLSYTGFANPSSTTVVTSVTPSVLKILVGTFPNPTTVPDGKLLDLQFDYLGGYSAITFHTVEYGTYGSNMLKLDVTTYFFADADVTNGAVEGYWENTISGGDWHTASDWTLNAVPTVWHNVTVANGTESTAGAAAVANNVTIEQGGELTLNSTLNAGGDFLIESNASGSGSFINNGTLTIVGASSAQCYVTDGQWHGITAPVSGEDFLAMYLGGNPKVWVRQFDESSDTYANMDDTTQAMGDMLGWFTWIQTGTSPQTFTFEGAFRTGTVGSASNMAYSLNGWNFVGNPLTSAIDWDAASGWTKTNLNDATYVYDNGTWATYVGGIGANGGTQHIAMSQGFFVQATATGTLQMDENVAVHNPVGYMKSQMAEQKIVRLQLEDNGSLDETVIRFTEDATIGYDGNFDAHKLFSFDDEYPQIYSTANDFMSINSLPEESVESVSLDVRGLDGNSMTISNTEADEVFVELNLRDESTGEVTNLLEKSYTFTYNAEMTDRFTLFFGYVGIDDPISSDNFVKIFATDGHVNIVLNGSDQANISVYNLLGQEVAANFANSTTTRIPIYRTGYYLVKVSDGEHIITQKVFIK